LVGRLQIRLAPETVAHPGRDDQRVVGLLRRRTVVMGDDDVAGVDVDPRQGAVHGAHPVQPAELLEWNPVGASPVVRAGQPPAQFLAADQRRLRRDPYDLDVAGQPDCGEHAAIAETGNDDATQIHAHTLTYEE